MNNMQSCSPILYNVQLSKDNWSLKGKQGKGLTAAMRSAQASSDLTPLLQPLKEKQVDQQKNKQDKKIIVRINTHMPWCINIINLMMSCG